MRIFKYQLLTSGNMSADVTTDPQQLNQMYLCAVQASWTGSPVGTLTLEVTNDDPSLVASPIWSTYTGSSTAVSGAGNFLWNIGSCGFNYIRVFYDYTSGTGSLSVTVSGKGP